MCFKQEVKLDFERLHDVTLGVNVLKVPVLIDEGRVLEMVGERLPSLWGRRSPHPQVSLEPFPSPNSSSGTEQIQTFSFGDSVGDTAIDCVYILCSIVHLVCICVSEDLHVCYRG